MNNVDEVQFGRLLEKVATLEEQVSAQGRDIKALLFMAERGKGALWAGMSLAATAGAVVSWIASHIWPK